jgi:Protein of unknown function (DUF2958)
VLGFEPVVKLFTADGNATWLLSELNPDIDLAFGLCDLVLGEPELGYVSLVELAAARSRSRPARPTARLRSSLRDDTNDLGIRRARPRASTHRHLMR